MARTARNTPDRSNQRRRTRKELLAAAARLIQSGNTPDMDAVASEAMVSRATAYRYFPSIEALLLEAPLDGDAPEPSTLFGPDAPSDPAERLNLAEAALHDMCLRNEAQLRLMLAASIERVARGEVPEGTPIRQNRRTGLIDAALAPHRSRFTPEAYRRLAASLALVFGTESMVVFSDVLGLKPHEARKVKAWMIESLVAAAATSTELARPSRAVRPRQARSG